MDILARFKWITLILVGSTSTPYRSSSSPGRSRSSTLDMDDLPGALFASDISVKQPQEVFEDQSGYPGSTTSDQSQRSRTQSSLGSLCSRNSIDDVIEDVISTPEPVLSHPSSETLPHKSKKINGN